MFKRLEDFDRSRDNLILMCIFIIYVVLTVSYILEYTKGNRTFEYIVTYICVLWIPYLVSVFCFRVKKYSGYVKYAIEIGYLLFYGFSLYTTVTSLTWIYIFPVSCVLPLFYTNMGILFSCFGVFVGMNLFEVYINRAVYLATPLAITELEQRMACIFLCFIFLIVSVYVYRYIHNMVVIAYEDNDIDALTGLHGSKYIGDTVSGMIENNQNLVYSAIYINMDNFSHFNNVFGHTYGDTILKRVSDVIARESEIVKANASVCRLIGDKFIVVVSNRSLTEVSDVALAIKGGINTLIFKKGAEEVVASATVCCTDTRCCGHSYNEIYRRIGVLQKSARSHGTNKVIFDSPVRGDIKIQ